MILSKIKEEAILNYVPIVKDKTLEKIIELIKEKKIKNILEIGTAVGYSAASFASIDKDIKVFTIEKDEKRYLEAKKNIEELDLIDQVKIFLGDANEILGNNILKEYMEKDNIEFFDMIFIDAAKGQYINFLNKSLKYLRKNSYIIADNVLFKGYVLGNYEGKKHRTIVNNLRSFLEIMQNEEKFETEIVDIDDGFLISKIKCNINVTI